MKIKHYILSSVFLLILNTGHINSQILNNSFETWEEHTPTNWVTSNTALLTNVTFSPDSHDGGLSANMIIKDFNGLPLAATLTTENTNSFNGHPVNERYGTLKGYYKSELFGKGRYRISVLAWHSSGDAIGSADTLIVESTGNWQLIELPIEYFDDRVPASIFISFSIFDSTGAEPAAIDSWVLMDNLSLGGIATGIKDEKNAPLSFSLSQNYPNPFNPTTTIKYSIPMLEALHATSQLVQLKIYDLLGREIASLVNEKQPAGNYSVNFNGSNLTSGVYIIRLTAGNYVQSKKMTLMK